MHKKSECNFIATKVLCLLVVIISISNWGCPKPAANQQINGVSQEKTPDPSNKSDLNKTTEYWLSQSNKARETRDSEVGPEVKGLIVPPELLENNSLKKQEAKIKELNLQMPKDFAALAEMLLNGKVVELPFVTEDYLLEGGGSATDTPFTSFDPETGKKSELEPNRMEILQRLANDFNGQKYDLNKASDRKTLRMRLLLTVTPETKPVLEEIARIYRERFNRPLRITSLIRSLDYQYDLSKSNSNAKNSKTPLHSTGLAIDLAVTSMTAEEQNFLMEKMAEMERGGKLEALREDKGILHIFVYPDGKPPKV